MARIHKYSAVCRYYPYRTSREFDAAKREAKRQVSLAVASGALKRQSCERCSKRAEAHHEDYSKPLVINWLCRKHHRQRHHEILEGHAEALTALQLEPINIRVYHQLLSNPEVSKGLIFNATMELSRVLVAEGVSENSLADRMGVSRQHINAIFHGGVRTLKTLGGIANALGHDVQVVLVRRARKTEAA